MSADRVAPMSGILADARAWLADAFGDHDLPADLTDAEVLGGIQRHYDGGLDAFLSDGRYDAQVSLWRYRQ